MHVRRTFRATALASLALAVSVSCALPGTYTDAQIADSLRELRALGPAIEAGLALAKPDTPTSRALTPSALETSGVDTPWPYGTQTPAEVYTAAGGGGATVRLPSAGYYQLTSGDQLYFTLTPEAALGSTFYRLVLYTYPAFDLVVMHTTEEYIVDAAESSGIWAWGNRDATGTASGWVSLTTVYIDGTTGRRDVVWASSATDTTYYAAFTVGEPDPDDPASFTGYRYEESDTPPVARSGTEVYSSATTERVNGGGTVVEALQYYTETTVSAHTGLTYVLKDKKGKWGVDTRIVTRMTEDTAAGTRSIRSVGEVGTNQYYIDRVDISRPGGVITYTSSHDVYDTALPRGGDPTARDYVAIELNEDGAGEGTFTGTLESTSGGEVLRHTLVLARDLHYRMALTLTYETATPRGIEDALSIPITAQDLSALSIDLPGVAGLFEGFYEAGSLFGSVTAGGRIYEVAVAEEGVAVDGRLYRW